MTANNRVKLAAHNVGREGIRGHAKGVPRGGAFSCKDNNGPLIVTGRRLNGPAAPSFTEIEPISWDHEMIGGETYRCLAVGRQPGAITVRN